MTKDLKIMGKSFHSRLWMALLNPSWFFSRKADAVLGVQAGDTQAWLRLLNSDRAHWHPSWEKTGVLAVSLQNLNFYNVFSMSDWKKTRRRTWCIDEAPWQEIKKFEAIPSASYQPPPEEFLGATSPSESHSEPDKNFMWAQAPGHCNTTEGWKSSLGLLCYYY